MYPGEYLLIGNQLSFFSRKLEAQLRFQQIPWRWLFKTQERAPELEARAGTHFIPLLQTPDRWIINDTIAIGPMLNDRFSEHPVIPTTPAQRSACFILEDALNHWMGRAAVHSRWCYPENVEWVGLRFGANMMLDQDISEALTAEEHELVSGIGQMMYQGFGKNVCETLGVGPDESDKVQADFQALLAALDSHLEQHSFLLGERPCLADFALAGVFKAHFITDPTPKGWLGNYAARMTEYTEHFFGDTIETSGSWIAEDALPESLSPLLDYLKKTYYTLAPASISAAMAGEKFYTLDYGYGPVQVRSQKRLDLARRHVQDEIRRCGGDHQASLKATFGERGILDYYLL